MRQPPGGIASAALILAGVAALALAALRPRGAAHPVTPAMRAEAGAMAGRPAPTLALVGTDGAAHSPAGAACDRAAVVFFIQDGCPCSEAADPHFRRLRDAYGDRAAFLGVIDADLATARDWAARHATPYPILADPRRELIAACRVGRSASALLVAPGGRVEALWPGYSAGMLAEVGARLARRAARAEVPLDTRDAPRELTAGCRF